MHKKQSGGSLLPSSGDSRAERKREGKQCHVQALMTGGDHNPKNLLYPSIKKKKYSSGSMFDTQIDKLFRTLSTNMKMQYVMLFTFLHRLTLSLTYVKQLFNLSRHLSANLNS